jgi:hypothetical protein
MALKKQIVEEFDDDDFGDEEEEVENEEAFMNEEEEQPQQPTQRKPAFRPRPTVEVARTNPAIEVARTNKFAPQPKTIAEDRFVAVHSPAIEGIIDKQTNKLVTNDLWEALARIISSQQRIEESLG